MTTPENYSRAAARLQMLQQPIGVATSPTVRYRLGETPADTGRVIETIVDTGRTKRVPRTLQQAFPISEGYRHAVGRLAADGSLQPLNGPLPKRRLVSYVTTDRVCWAIVIGLALMIVQWAWMAPKGHP